MSDIFFTEMEIPKPKYNLEINSLSHGAMTGRMTEEIEKILLQENPDWLLVYGDTNSTLAGALAAVKLHIKVAHVEAGLRSFNMRMPEEVNRILTDRVSSVLFCPTQQAINNLHAEGYENINTDIVKSGDVMYDAALFYKKKMKKPGIELPEKFILATVHRAENTNDLDKLKNIISDLNRIHEKEHVIVPLHPRTKNLLDKHDIEAKFQIIPPQGYLEIVYLLDNCTSVFTDSGGMQKEAYFFKKPCVTLRDQTEWVELIDEGVNQLVETAKSGAILEAYNSLNISTFDFSSKLYGNGNSAEKIVQSLLDFSAS